MTPKRKPASRPVETEAKIRVTAFPAVRVRLRAAGARKVRAQALESNALFDSLAGDLRGSGQSLRVRRYGSTGSLTLKGVARVSGGLKSRVELESEVAAPETIEEILVSLGFRPTFRYEKFREVWKLGSALVCLDETPAGRFVEIEGDEAVIHRAAARLGLDPSRFLSDSYPAVWAATGASGDMVFARRPSAPRGRTRGRR